MEKMNRVILDIRPHKNTMIPPYSCPEVLMAPADASIWEGSPWKAFQMMTTSQH